MEPVSVLALTHKVLDLLTKFRTETGMKGSPEFMIVLLLGLAVGLASAQVFSTFSKQKIDTGKWAPGDTKQVRTTLFVAMHKQLLVMSNF